MKKVAAILLLFLLLHSLFPKREAMLYGFAEALFRSCLDHPTLRAVFDLEEEEAVAVFGEDADALFL